MDKTIHDAIYRAVENEPFAQRLGMRLLELADGYALVEMQYRPETMGNIYRRAHGGAVFALIDEAFEAACQADGTITVALNVNVNYVTSPQTATRLKAEARRVSQTRKTAGYDITVTDENDNLIATCQALAYRTGKPIPFL
ncbi:MAG: PaaI family thioesterase [Desulfobacterales bacterium]|nr:PaaI family thioesterase [Desulfobacterales bacterium]